MSYRPPQMNPLLSHILFGTDLPYYVLRHPAQLTCHLGSIYGTGRTTTFKGGK